MTLYRFVQLELVFLFLVPALLVFNGIHLNDDKWVAYVSWILLGLMLRGFLAVLFDVHIAFKAWKKYILAGDKDVF